MEALLFQSTIDIHFQNARKTQTPKFRTECRIPLFAFAFARWSYNKHWHHDIDVTSQCHKPSLFYLAELVDILHLRNSIVTKLIGMQKLDVSKKVTQDLHMRQYVAYAKWITVTNRRRSDGTPSDRRHGISGLCDGSSWRWSCPILYYCQGKQAGIDDVWEIF